MNPSTAHGPTSAKVPRLSGAQLNPYLNYSCDPNGMRHGVKVFAWKPIAAGDEITIDYRPNAFEDNETWVCSVGEPEMRLSLVGSNPLVR